MEENENTIQYFLNTHPDFELEHIEVAEGLSSGFINDTTRLWPHKLNGEGHFFAVLRKKGASNNSNIEYKTETSISPKEYIECINFLKDNLNISLNGTFIKFGDQIYLVPDNTPSLKGLKIVRSGLHLGTIMKNRFEPSHSLALYLKPENVKKHCNLSSREQTIYDYINGQTFSYTGDKGWYLISVDNYSIGWGKLSGDTMKNHYPKGLRKKLPLTTTFS
jgi:NOL1/NOP2/fmu family ribosome biogenesis protein